MIYKQILLFEYCSSGLKSLLVVTLVVIPLRVHRIRYAMLRISSRKPYGLASDIQTIRVDTPLANLNYAQFYSNPPFLYLYNEVQIHSLYRAQTFPTASIMSSSGFQVSGSKWHMRLVIIKAQRKSSLCLYFNISNDLSALPFCVPSLLPRVSPWLWSLPASELLSPAA